VKGDRILPGEGREGREGNAINSLAVQEYAGTRYSHANISMREFSVNRRVQASKHADDEFLISSNIFYDKSNHFATCIVLHISSREENKHRIYAISIFSIITPLPQIIILATVIICPPIHSLRPILINPCPHFK
jgi:hypothetical protein